MAGEIMSSQTARETADVKDQNEMAVTLREFGRSVVALRSMMDQDRSFNRYGITFH